MVNVFAIGSIVPEWLAKAKTEMSRNKINGYLNRIKGFNKSGENRFNRILNESPQIAEIRRIQVGRNQIYKM